MPRTALSAAGLLAFLALAAFAAPTRAGAAVEPPTAAEPADPPDPARDPAGLPAPEAGEARLLRHPHHHAGLVAFSFLGDIWTAFEDGSDVRRITAHLARDIFPRFSPDGRWIAFSSDRQGNMDVYVVPAEGGEPAQLTFHSAEDEVLGWAPDGSAVLFASNRGDGWAAKLYTVSTAGGMPGDVGADMGIFASYSPDGSRLALNRRSQAYWRKGYRGSNQSDVTVMDLAERRFRDLTDFEGMDRWPLWAADGRIYFVSDRDGPQNLWRVPEAGGAAEKVTAFADGEVRWPALGTDGRTIVFERDFRVWKLDTATGEASPLRFRIAAETQEGLVERRVFESELDDYDLAPSGKRIALSTHGEVFTAPVEEGDLERLTDGAARDRTPVYSPDGKQVAFVSDRSGRPELWIAAADGSAEPRRITDLDALAADAAWSPSGEEIAFTASDNTLRVVKVATGELRTVATSGWGPIGAPAWSPDGRWIAFSRPDHSRTSDVWLVPAAGGEPRRVTFDGYSDFAPAFSPDGRTLFFLRSSGLEAAIAGPPWADLHAVSLAKQEKDPDDPATRDEAGAGEKDEAGRAPSSRATPAGAGQRPEARTADPVAIDWAGLEKRTRRLTRMPYPIGSFAATPDGKTLVFVTREAAGTRTAPVIYSIGADGEKLARVYTGSGGGDDDGPSSGGIGSLRVAPDSRGVFFREGRSVYSVALRAGGGEDGGRGASRKRVSFRAPVTIDRRAEWHQMFDDAWTVLRHRFYDPAMHGVDWAAARERYRPFVRFAGHNDEVLNILNEMIGELNASHSGTRPAAERGGPNVSTPHLGLDLEPDDGAGRYRVAYVYEHGPAGKDWVGVGAGDWLIAIEGVPVRAGDNYWKLLNERLNRRVEVTFAKSPSGAGAWTARIDPASQGAYRQLRYERWVEERRALVDSLSGGRIAYVHIQGMNQPSLERFQKEIRQYRDREALVIDQRWNGGGNIEQQLLHILAARPYQILVPRGSDSTYRPAGAFPGPKVVLQNWRSGSNAEMFPAGFKALGLGKVIGTPTAGAVIGTGSYQLVDGSAVRVPALGVYLVDERRTNMENYGVPPDITVEPTPEDNLAGRDPVIERAVAELLAELEAGGIKARR